MRNNRVMPSPVERFVTLDKHDRIAKIITTACTLARDNNANAIKFNNGFLSCIRRPKPTIDRDRLRETLSWVLNAITCNDASMSIEDKCHVAKTYLACSLKLEAIKLNADSETVAIAEEWRAYLAIKCMTYMPLAPC
jgi:hypothetical protein